jgi:hypothetical protein
MRRIAVSRRFSKVLPRQVSSSARSSSSLKMSTGCSGTAGGRIRPIGERGISPSSSSHRNSCCIDR